MDGLDGWVDGRMDGHRSSRRPVFADCPVDRERSAAILLCCFRGSGGVSAAVAVALTAGSARGHTPLQWHFLEYKSPQRHRRSYRRSGGAVG